MRRYSVASNPAWSHIGFSRAVRVGDVIEVAGTSSSGPNGEVLHPGDLYRQTRQCIETVIGAVEELGGTASDIVRTRLFMTEIDRWDEAGRAHGEAFATADPKPATAFIGINRLVDPDMLIEVEATAVLDVAG